MALLNSIGQTKFRSNAELDQEERDKVTIDRPAEEPTVGLAAHVRDVFDAAVTAKVKKIAEQLATLRRINGEYEQGLLAAIKEARLPTDYTQDTYHKCRDAESYITEILSSLGLDRTWDIVIDGEITIPPQDEALMVQQVRSAMMQQAEASAQQTGQQIDPEQVIAASKKMEEEIKQEVLLRARSLSEERAVNMEQKILSQLEGGGWNEAFKAIVNDLTKFKCCIIKGPVYRKKKVLKYSGAGLAQVADEIAPMFDRVNWFDWFPAANSIKVEDGDCIEMEHMQRKDFTKLLGVPGYKDDAIRKILRIYGDGYKENTTGDSQRFTLEQGNNFGYNDGRTNKIDALNYWGEVPGSLLVEKGISVPDPDLDYQVNVKMVGNVVYKAVINPDLLGKKPYHVTSFVKSNDSQQGKSPADLMETIQDEINQAVRFRTYNIAISAGPITEIDIDRLADGQKAEVFPGAVLETHGKNMTTPAVRITQTDIRSRELNNVIIALRQEADDVIVPSFSSSEAGGADKTMGGRAMKIAASKRNISLACENVDNDIIVPAITMLFNYNMLFVDDPNIKGALKLKARGINKQIIKAILDGQREEFTRSLSPEDKQIMGTKGIAYNLYNRAKALELDPDKIIPNYRQIEQAPNKPETVTPGPAEAAQARKFDAEALKLKTSSILDIANSEAAEPGRQLDQYEAFTDRLSVGVAQQQADNQGQPPPSAP